MPQHWWVDRTPFAERRIQMEAVPCAWVSRMQVTGPTARAMGVQLPTAVRPRSAPRQRIGEMALPVGEWASAPAALGQSMHGMAPRNPTYIDFTQEQHNHCPIGAVSSTSLQEGEMQHAGGKLYQCMHCSETFPQRSSLRRHKMIHQPGRL
jgi:hypothetical protein